MSTQGYVAPPSTVLPPAGSYELDRLFRQPGRDGRGRDICAQGHLVCQGNYCGGSCACGNDDGGDFAITVRTDKDGDTLCKECRYEMKAAPWNH